MLSDRKGSKGARVKEELHGGGVRLIQMKRTNRLEQVCFYALCTITVVERMGMTREIEETNSSFWHI
jgi:hypothetical protein